MGYHVAKDEVKLCWLDSRDQVKLDLRKIMRRVENEVLIELEDRFVDGLNRGEILNLRPGEESLRELVQKHALLLLEENE